jgi:hypothetical protein
MALTATAMTSTALRPLPAELVNFSGSGLNGAVGMVFIAALLIGPIMGSGNSANNLQNALGSGAVALVPVAIGVAVLRYRLYDIDRIISRTVAYAIVTGLLVGVYSGSVLLATQVLHFRTPVAVAAATLAAAALFTRYGGALEPAHVSVWISRPQARSRPGTCWPGRCASAASGCAAP